MSCLDGKFIIRTSDRGMFKNCRQRWDWASKLRQNYEPLGSQRALNFGTSIHAALEEYYRPLSIPRQDRERFTLAAFIASEEGYKRKAIEASGDVSLDADADVEFQERMDLGLGMLSNYFSWAPEQDSNYEPLFVELEFEVPIPCNDYLLEKYPLNAHIAAQYDDSLHLFCSTCETWHPVVYQGRIDLLVKDQYERLWIVDHKTAASFGSGEHLELDEQCGSYCWALQKMLNLPVAGVIYNQLLKSVPKEPDLLKSGGLSKAKNQKTTYELYVQALTKTNLPYADYADILEFLKDQPNKFFRRLEVHRSQYEHRVLEERIYVEALEMLCDPWIYPNPGMFNCMGCSFRIPCIALQDGSDVDYILETNYRKK